MLRDAVAKKEDIANHQLKSKLKNRKAPAGTLKAPMSKARRCSFKSVSDQFTAAAVAASTAPSSMNEKWPMPIEYISSAKAFHIGGAPSTFHPIEDDPDSVYFHLLPSNSVSQVEFGYPFHEIDL
jgi:hypothetical protein